MSWHWTRLKFLAEIPIRNGVGEAGGYDEPSWPRYVRTTDISGPRALRGDVFASLPPDVAKLAMLCRGDIVMTAAGTIGKSHLYNSDAPACYAGYLVRFRPKASLDGRFIAYWTESQGYWDQIATGKVASTIDNFSASKYQNLRLCVPSFAEQRAIADFLDCETARIDALVEAKKQMVALLEERFQAKVTERLNELAAQCGRAPLKRSVRRIEVGIVITPSAWYSDDGIIALRGVNVGPGTIDMGDAVHLTPEGHRLHAKSTLRAGDVVVVRTGKAGAAAVVPPDLDGANCIDLVIVRPSAKIYPQFLEYVLNSEWSQRHIEEHSVGSIQSHFNVGAMSELPVPLPPLHEQKRVVASLNEAAARHRGLTRKLSRQVDLLAEHRQALITAAVTGELKIPGAAA